MSVKVMQVSLRGGGVINYTLEAGVAEAALKTFKERADEASVVLAGYTVEGWPFALRVSEIAAVIVGDGQVPGAPRGGMTPPGRYLSGN
jgi:hypothetical protein